MRRKIYVLSIIIFFFASVYDFSYAENVYVSDELEITMRTGPKTDRKIISILNSGQILEIIEKGDEWSNVRLPNGKEGWVLTRYLSSEEPSRLAVQRLTAKLKSLETQCREVFEENSKLSKENQGLKSELKTTKDKLDSTVKSYEELKDGSKDYIRIKKEHEELTDSLKIAQTRADRFEQKVLIYARNDSLKWFLSGAGVFLLGLLIGMILASRKKNRSYLV